MNIYKPDLMTIEDMHAETQDTKTLKLVFQDEEKRRDFSYNVGQFGEFIVFGVGECTINISSSSTWKEFIQCTFRKVGRVTKELAEMNPGDTIGFRGPYGNWWPVDRMKGKNIVFVAGGIALPPLRCLIWYCLDNRNYYKDITIIYGARTVQDLVYKDELKKWQERADVQLIKTVDPGGETKDWDGKVGFVPTVLGEVAPSSENSLAVICGPPIMIKFTFPVLLKLGFQDDSIWTSLENKMKCGLGKCGRCNVGPFYVCKDGPVFSYKQVKEMPNDF